MKKYLLSIAVLFCGIILFSSCKKQKETKYVTVNETVKSGQTYSLDMSAYGDKSSIATITKQATNFTVSQVDYDNATRRNIYHYSVDTKVAEQENVVIEVKEKSNAGGCMHDSEKTVVTINLAIQQ